jgi:glycerol-3-phosphate acyltransferase PlsY
MTAVWALLLGYLLGSIPFGVLITRAIGAGDLRQIGSGNIGATNVLRTGRKGAAVATLLLDGGKGAVAVLLGGLLFAHGPLAGLGAFLGHLFPVWLRFKGGKGVATFLGIVLALSPMAGLIACSVWLATAVVTRISSASALVASTVTPLWFLLKGQPETAAIMLAMTALIWVKHAGNIRRILDGTEPKIGKSSQK